MYPSIEGDVRAFSYQLSRSVGRGLLDFGVVINASGVSVCQIHARVCVCARACASSRKRAQIVFRIFLPLWSLQLMLCSRKDGTRTLVVLCSIVSYAMLHGTRTLLNAAPGDVSQREVGHPGNGCKIMRSKAMQFLVSDS